MLQQYPLCFFATRYRGRGVLSHVLPACGIGGKTLLAAGLAVLLLYLAGQPLPHKGQCWKLLFLASVLYALFKSLGVLVRSTPRSLFFSGLCLSPHCSTNTKNHTLNITRKMCSLLKGTWQCPDILPSFSVFLSFQAASSLVMWDKPAIRYFWTTLWEDPKSCFCMAHVQLWVRARLTSESERLPESEVNQAKPFSSVHTLWAEKQVRTAAQWQVLLWT